MEQTNDTARTAVLIVNTAARHGERRYTRALHALAARGIALVAAYPVEDPASLPAVTRKAIEQGAHLVIVGGGDGTISAVVDECAYRDVVFGLLPLGTGNSFARTMGIPLSLERAADVIATGRVAHVDLGKVGDDYFANIADIGISAEMARTTPARLKRYLGKLAYVLVGGEVLLRHRPFVCHLRVGDEERIFRTHEVIVANGRYYGDTVLHTQASAEDRRLIVVSVDGLSRWRQLRVWVAFLLRRPLDFSRNHACIARDIWIETDPPQAIDVDGESRMHTPAHFSVAPGALQMLVSA